MATHSDRSDWDSDTLHVKDVLPSFLDLSKFPPEMIDVKWLPPVPNLNVFRWVSWLFQYHTGSSALPELIIQPPTRVLPALSGEIDREESSHRFDYWFSFLVCGPPVMACLCEMIRLLSLTIKRHFAKPKEPLDYDHVENVRVAIVRAPSVDSPSSSEDEVYVCDDYLQSQACLGFAVVCYHLFCVSVVVIALASDWISIKGGGTISWELWVVWQHACLWALFLQNLFRCYYADAQSLGQKSTIGTVLLYTAPLVSELTDTMKDWVITGICLTAQPSKVGMLWGLLFVLADFFPRTLSSPPNSFPFRIVGRVWMPLIVWQIVLAGSCLLVLLTTPQGLMIGAACSGLICVAALNLCGQNCLCPMLACPILVILVALPYLVVNYVATLHADEMADARAVLAHFLVKVLTNSGALFIVSFYVICAAYCCVASDKDGAREMRRTYLAILAWPTRIQTHKVGSIGSIEQVYLQMSNKAVDFLSTARLLIAWVEDWPQGLLGLLLALGHRDQIGSFGFAAFSAIISFSKGILIPLGQWIIVSVKQAEVRRALMDSEQLATYFGDNSSLTHNRILSRWQQALEERARDVLSNANILEGLDLYQSIYSDKHAWMMEHVEPTSLKPTSGSRWLQSRDGDGNKRASSLFACVCGAVASQQKDPEQSPDSCFARVCRKVDSCFARVCRAVASQQKDPEQRPDSCFARVCGFDDPERPDGASLDEILRIFPPEACRLAGFLQSDIRNLGKKIREAGWSLDECGKASYTVAMCLEAGYTKDNFKKIGFNRLRLVSGFKEEELASIGIIMNGTGCRELKEAGFSLEQCVKAGYTKEMCLDAGYEDL